MNGMNTSFNNYMISYRTFTFTYSITNVNLQAN